MNYDKYDWYYDDPKKENIWEYNKRSLEEDNGGLLISGGTTSCTGSKCCSSDTFWDDNRCRPIPIHGLDGEWKYVTGSSEKTVRFKANSERTGILTGLDIQGTYSFKHGVNNIIYLTVDDDSGNKVTYTGTIEDRKTGNFINHTFN